MDFEPAIVKCDFVDYYQGMSDASDTYLPPSAICVFKGEIFEVWQWQQELFNGTKATFERIRRPDTALVVATVGEQILIEREQQPHWPAPLLSLPAGRCEFGEFPLDAAKRELLEETGYASGDWSLWHSFEPDPFHHIIWSIFIYIARNCVKKQAQLLDPGERITVQSVSFEEFLNLATNDSFRDPHMKNILLRAKYETRFRNDLQALLFTK